MLGIAFKEWAAVCRALGDGRQTLLLRKGGIAEAGGAFRPEYDRFWLYPTHFHERQQPGLKPDAGDAGIDCPPGAVRLGHFVEVPEVLDLDDLDAALRLDPLHVWTAEVVRQRFHYRSPGLFVLPARVYRVTNPVSVPERPEYAGCKSWVPLDRPVEELPAEPVLSDAEWERQLRRLRELLGR